MREAIFAFVSSDPPNEPKGKKEIMEHLTEDLVTGSMLGDDKKADNTLVNSCLKRLVDKKRLCSVGKKQGNLRGWILPDHEEKGNQYFKEKEAAKKPMRSISEAKQRQGLIEEYVTNQGVKPSRKPEIMDHVKTKGIAYSDDKFSTDMTTIGKTTTFVKIGGQRGDSRGLILAVHKEAFEQQEQARLATEKAARGPTAAEQAQLRRDAIKEYVTKQADKPSRKPEIMNHVLQKTGVPITDTQFNTDMATIVKSGSITAVGDKKGEHRGWIRAEHKEAGDAICAEEKKADANAKAEVRKEKAALQRTTDATPGEYIWRRDNITKCLCNGSSLPKTRDEVVAFLKELDDADEDAKKRITGDSVRLDLKVLCSEKEAKITELKLSSKPKSRQSWFTGTKDRANGQKHVDDAESKQEEAARAERENSKEKKEHEKRRDFIVEVISSNPGEPKRKGNILSRLQKHKDYAAATDATVNRDLKALVDSSQLVSVGKQTGENKGWILPEYKLEGETFFEDECEQKREQKQKVGGYVRTLCAWQCSVFCSWSQQIFETFSNRFRSVLLFGTLLCCVLLSDPSAEINRGADREKSDKTKEQGRPWSRREGGT